MAVSLTHAFSSAKSDGTDSTLIQPSNWNAQHTLTMATARLLGRTTASTGAAEEISAGANLALSAGSIDLASNIAVSTATAPLVIGGTTASSTLTLESTSGTGTSDAILFKTGSQVERMRIDTSGNVGIGISTLQDKLQVLNTLGLQTSATYSYINFRNSAQTLAQQIQYNDSDGSLTIGGGSPSGGAYPVVFRRGTSTESARIDASGNLLIGTTTSGNSKLYVNGSAAAAIVALTDAATIAVDMSTGNNFSVTLGGNRTLGNPTNLTPGQSGIIYVTQDATGSRTLAYSSYWKFPGGTAPTLTTTAAAVDALVYTVRTSTSITVQSLLNIA
jgi:hypothetical protein